MAKSAFLPFVIGIRFTDRILRNPRKIKGSFDYKTETRKEIIFPNEPIINEYS